MIKPKIRPSNEAAEIAKYKADKRATLLEWNNRLRHMIQDVQAVGHMSSPKIEIKLFEAQRSVLDSLDRLGS